MSLQFVPGISCLPDPGVERVVHRVELVPHLVGACTQSAVDFSSQAFRGGPFFLGSCDVLLGIPHPWIGNCNSVNKDVDDWYCTVKVRSYAKCPRLARHFLVTFELLYFFAFFFNFYFFRIWVITMHRPFVNKKINKASMFACLTDFVQRSHIWWTKIWQNIKD